jgi:hypothetical protein
VLKSLFAGGWGGLGGCWSLGRGGGDLASGVDLSGGGDSALAAGDLRPSASSSSLLEEESLEEPLSSCAQ